MTTFTKLFIAYSFIVLTGVIYSASNFYQNITPSARQASEEVMVNTANVLATIFTSQFDDSQKSLDEINNIISRYKSREESSPDWSKLTTKNELNFYITDRDGVVIAHSDKPEEAGKDYSKWNDVRRTLAGKYGARTTRVDPDRDDTAVMYVAAPMYLNQEIVGVVTVIQGHKGLRPYISKAQRNVLITSAMVIVGLIVFGFIIITVVHSSVKKITQYVNSVRNDKNVSLVSFKDPLFSELATAMHDLRKELDGKAYIENYVHTLTHELKTPLSAISSATQILKQDISTENRDRFLVNIECESERMRDLVDRVLLLAQVENTSLQEMSLININSLIEAELESFEGLLEQYDLKYQLTVPQNACYIQGDEFLLSLAIRNLLANAIEFSIDGSKIVVTLSKSEASTSISIKNTGPNIPDYAIPRLYERFFSTPRERTKRKSSGLGLCLTKEICELHNATLTIENTNDGVLATIAITPRDNKYIKKT